MPRPTPPVTAPAPVLRAAALALLCRAAPALGQQNLHEDDRAFNLFNDSGIPLLAFQIQEMSGAFGHNWLMQPMAPGNGLTLEFTDPRDTRCEILTRVIFTNGATRDGYIDDCGTAIMQVTNAGLFYE